jgi:hypothetical protein
MDIEATATIAATTAISNYGGKRFTRISVSTAAEAPLMSRP